MKQHKSILIMFCFTAFCFHALLSSEISAAENNPDGASKNSSTKIYLIGNSLTWDTVPSKLEGDVQWHVDCGKSLKYIFENPQEPCVKTSTLWPTALKKTKFDLISFQPHYGTTVQEDLETISKWIELQPQATIIIHTGWAKSASLLEEHQDDSPDGKLTHSPAYFNELLAQLRKAFPDTEFRTTHCMRMLIELESLIEAGDAPYDAVTDIYRDAIHMKNETGRYLMHNAMRETFGQERTTQGFPKISDEQRATLDQLLDQRNTWEAARPAKKL
ncbi:hypothetical protein [Thalassoglobus sp.]|uniref:hypothetical protein n=1 Tax=Thalassoglobus sp. TaxID=2795869 RepID=UPI003AA8FE39